MHEDGKLTWTQVERIHHCAQGVGEAVARGDAKGNGDVVDGLDVVLCLDYGVEPGTGRYRVGDSYSDYTRTGEGEKSSGSYEGTLKMHGWF